MSTTSRSTSRSTFRSTGRRLAAGGGLLAAGAVAGGILAGTLTAGAATTATGSAGTSSSTAAEAPSGQQQVDPSQPQRPDEQLLTGDTKSKVEAAVLAKYPGATIERTETDSDGVYESHVVTTGGQHLVVQVGSDFAVTGTQTGGGPGGHGRTGTGPGTASGSGPATGEGGA